jgi:hypothetical protein
MAPYAVSSVYLIELFLNNGLSIHLFYFVKKGVVASSQPLLILLKPVLFEHK